METWTIIVLLFVALAASSLFFRSVGPDEMRRKSDVRLLRALELAKQSSNKKDLPVVLAEVERRGLLKPPEQDDLNRLSQKQPPITQGSLKVSIDGGATELTFYELAETLVLLSMNGNYGLLFHDEDDMRIFANREH